ncbi:N-acetyltransferase [Nocardioides guangzhouensis]|uniref:N-acetyltransferase n=1 Tax=Nocardioides guangzhouensis TaxID=2497878 RepID=A0A4Q4ZC49_9ACTN|nr:GNAT family N-acetyltransferase [Nocardioides guangzhouensis]RYP85577.1 N-acetyltransferase [Nocardioides guangzhouensis]
MELVTDRLVLRDYRPGDLRAAHRFTSDPESVRFVTWGPNTLDQTRMFLQVWLEEQEAAPRTGFTLAVTEPGGETFGSVGIYRDGPHHAEMGLSVRRDRWGQGYATEAAAALLGFGFDELGLRRVWATCRPDNVASRRVLEKIGMSVEGRLRDHVLLRGTWQDSVLYAALTPYR